MNMILLTWFLLTKTMENYLIKAGFAYEKFRDNQADDASDDDENQ